MPTSNAQRRRNLAERTRREVEALAARGVRMAGNGFSPIVLVKGELNAEEAAGADLLSGADGPALRAALAALGYAPEDFCALSAVRGDADGASKVSGPGDPLDPDLFREAIDVLDPEAVILLDEVATGVMREAFVDALAAIEDFDTAMLMPGLVAPVLGRRVLALDGFEASLSDPAQKQRMWAYIKQLPPAGAPY
ncbi:MAG: hypothetical protein SOU51_07230 [Collinsella sp.]|nr:hypothetical protein [Collinsella sp.]